MVLTVSDAWLAAVPEHIVVDLFDLLVFVAHYKPNAMTAINSSHPFQLIVKLLSPKYAHAIRNYNLHAKL